MIIWSPQHLSSRDIYTHQKIEQQQEKLVTGLIEGSQLSVILFFQ